MNKEKLDGFINRYSLGGEIDSVMLKSTDDELSVGIISDDKALLGEVKVTDDKFPVGEFGVYTTSQLQGMLGVLDSDIDIDATKESLVFNDAGTTVQYMLAEASVIPNVPDLKTLPEFNITINLDEEFVNTFSKSQKALKDVKTFTFMSEDDESRIVLGYSSINSNRISMDVDAEVEGDVEPISFNSDYLKAILDANKDAQKSSMEISTDGLCRIQFEDGEFNSKYYIVESK